MLADPPGVAAPIDPGPPPPGLRGGGGTRRRRWNLPSVWPRRPSQRTPVLLEVIVVVWLLWVYDAINDLSPVRNQAALHHAQDIWRLEQRLHLDPERSLNRWIGHHAVLASVAANYYDNAHFVVTFGLVGLLWWRFPEVYQPLRNMLVGCNLIGFIVFWLYPVAPPRMLTGAGFSDTVAATHAFGSWHAGTLATHANELAAMPSLHIAWALWCSTAIWLISRRRLLRAVAIVYPLLTVIAVLTTGNHFTLDVIGGALTAALAGLGAFGWRRLRLRTPSLAGDGGPSATVEGCSP